jgi:hypothetical protein
MGLKFGLSANGRTEIEGIWEQGAEKNVDLRGRKWQEVRENYMNRSFIICIFRQMLLGWSNQGVWNGRDEKCIQNFNWKAWKRPLVNHGRRWEYNIRIDLKETDYEDVDWIQLAEDMIQWRISANTVMNLHDSALVRIYCVGNTHTVLCCIIRALFFETE